MSYRRRLPQRVPPPAAPVKTPPLPRHLRHVGPVARQAWRSLWRAAGAAAIDPVADAEAVHDYVALVDERERLRAMLQDGYDRTIVQRLGAVEVRIAQLRQELGLSPRARARLGLETAMARRAMTSEEPLPEPSPDDVLELGE